MTLQKKLIAAGFSAAVAASGAFLIAPFEGKVNEVYLDPAAILTSCYGHTGPNLIIGQTFSDDDCLDKLVSDLNTHNKQLLSAVKVPLSQSEHAAYLSFVYNIGIGQFKTSTLLKHLNADERVAACNQLPRWVYVKGKALDGLRKRRAAEQKFCLSELNP